MNDKGISTQIGHPVPRCTASELGAAPLRAEGGDGLDRPGLTGPCRALAGARPGSALGELSWQERRGAPTCWASSSAVQSAGGTEDGQPVEQGERSQVRTNLS